MTEFVLPTHTNALGGVFGGQIMAWMDICAAICAQRHAGSVMVTAGIDDLCFEQPIKLGEVVRLEATVTAAFRSSVEVEVIVRGENAMTGNTWPCVTAFLTFVAIDAHGRPVSVPPLLIESEEQKQAQSAAETRRSQRLSRRTKES